MIRHYRTFEDINNCDIPNCKINAGEGVKAAGAFENDAALWVHVTGVRLIVVVLGVDHLWRVFGAYSWAGAVAVKPDVLYDVATDAVNLPKGIYGLMNFDIDTAPQVGGLYYQNGPFELRWEKY